MGGQPTPTNMVLEALMAQRAYLDFPASRNKVRSITLNRRKEVSVAGHVERASISTARTSSLAEFPQFSNFDWELLLWWSLEAERDTVRAIHQRKTIDVALTENIDFNVPCSRKETERKRNSGLFRTKMPGSKRQ